MASLDQTISRNLRRFRKEKSLTQQELARAAHCAQSTISGIEQGKTKASRALIERVAKVFGVPEWRFFLDTITTKELHELPGELRELALLVKSRDPAVQKPAQELVRIVGLHLRLIRPRGRRLKQQD